MVIHDKEYNHTLGSLTPLGLVPQSVSMSRSHNRFGLSIWHVHRKRTMKMIASYRYVGAPVRQRNHLLKVASRSPTLSESISLIWPDSRAEATQIVDSWDRPVVSEVSW